MAFIAFAVRAIANCSSFLLLADALWGSAFASNDLTARLSFTSNSFGVAALRNRWTRSNLDQLTIQRLKAHAMQRHKCVDVL
jgi:hypothetical protein